MWKENKCEVEKMGNMKGIGSEWIFFGEMCEYFSGDIIISVRDFDGERGFKGVVCRKEFLNEKEDGINT